MTVNKVHYPDFNVLDEEAHWDPHTREIVDQRLDTSSFYVYQFLTGQEANSLFQLCSILLDDQRSPVIAYVVHHVDQTLKADIGESQRKMGVPKQTVLIRKGLALLDQACTQLHGSPFHVLDAGIRSKVVNELMQGSLPLQSDQGSIPVNDFMQKVLSEAVFAYYSHPLIWSEIGYAGPAYPRGYVRSGLGLTDPWEAQRNGQ